MFTYSVRAVFQKTLRNGYKSWLCEVNCKMSFFLINKVWRKKQTRVKDMNITFQIQTLILPLAFWSRLAAGQLKTQVLKQDSGGGEHVLI